MMRSLFSGVAGLKVHQTRMDVIGNNIANVNTTSYKSQSMVFSDLLYQTTQAASGANAERFPRLSQHRVRHSPPIIRGTS